MKTRNMEFTDTQLAKYMSGELRLKTNRKTGEHTLVKPMAGTPDKGVTTPARRAYYRVWYLKNRKERLRANKRYKLRVKTAHKQSKVDTLKAYQAAYRSKNRAKLARSARERYHKDKKKAGKTTKNYSKHAPKLLKWATDSPPPVKKTKKGLIGRILGSLFGS